MQLRLHVPLMLAVAASLIPAGSSCLLLLLSLSSHLPYLLPNLLPFMSLSSPLLVSLPSSDGAPSGAVAVTYVSLYTACTGTGAYSWFKTHTATPTHTLSADTAKPAGATHILVYAVNEVRLRVKSVLFVFSYLFLILSLSLLCFLSSLSNFRLHFSVHIPVYSTCDNRFYHHRSPIT